MKAFFWARWRTPPKLLSISAAQFSFLGHGISHICKQLLVSSKSYRDFDPSKDWVCTCFSLNFSLRIYELCPVLSILLGELPNFNVRVLWLRDDGHSGGRLITGFPDTDITLFSLKPDRLLELLDSCMLREDWSFVLTERYSVWHSVCERGNGDSAGATTETARVVSLVRGSLHYLDLAIYWRRSNIQE